MKGKRKEENIDSVRTTRLGEKFAPRAPGNAHLPLPSTREG